MPARYIPVLVVYVTACIATAWFYRLESEYLVGMRLTDGVVTAVDNKGTSSTALNGTTHVMKPRAIVSYVVDGHTRLAYGRCIAIPGWHMGQPVQVYYSPENSKAARLNRINERYFFTLCSALIVSIMSLMFVINHIVYKLRGRPLS